MQEGPESIQKEESMLFARGHGCPVRFVGGNARLCYAVTFCASACTSELAREHRASLKGSETWAADHPDFAPEPLASDSAVASLFQPSTARCTKIARWAAGN